MIVFEGINKSGKTTMARKLKRYLNWPIVRVVNISGNKGLAPMIDGIEKFGVKTNDFYEDMVQMEFINQAGNNKIIFDRSLPSAHAYRVYKGKEGLSDDILYWWFNSLKKNNGLYVWVDISWEQVLLRGKKDGWMETAQEYLKLKYEFNQLFQIAMRCRCKVLKLVNDESVQFENNVFEILRKMNEDEG